LGEYVFEPASTISNTNVTKMDAVVCADDSSIGRGCETGSAYALSFSEQSRSDNRRRGAVQKCSSSDFVFNRKRSLCHGYNPDRQLSESNSSVMLSHSSDSDFSQKDLPALPYQ
jgi:hypothetical protein